MTTLPCYRKINLLIKHFFSYSDISCRPFSRILQRVTMKLILCKSLVYMNDVYNEHKCINRCNGALNEFLWPIVWQRWLLSYTSKTSFNTEIIFSTAVATLSASWYNRAYCNIAQQNMDIFTASKLCQPSKEILIYLSFSSYLWDIII